MDKVQKMLFRIVSSELCEDIDSYKKFVGIMIVILDGVDKHVVEQDFLGILVHQVEA